MLVQIYCKKPYYGILYELQFSFWEWVYKLHKFMQMLIINHKIFLIM